MSLASHYVVSSLLHCSPSPSGRAALLIDTIFIVSQSLCSGKVEASMTVIPDFSAENYFANGSWRIGTSRYTPLL